MLRCLTLESLTKKDIEFELDNEGDLRIEVGLYGDFGHLARADQERLYEFLKEILGK